MGGRARQNSKNSLARPLVGPLNERGSSKGVQNWSQIQGLPTRSKLTSQKARLSRYVGACECRLNLKLAVTLLVHEGNGGPSNRILMLASPWCLSPQSIMRRFGRGTPHYIHIYHSQYESGLCAMCLMAHMVEFWYFLYNFLDLRPVLERSRREESIERAFA